MIFKFLLVSDEVENFRREIQIDADDTFFDLHKVIMKCCGYEETEMTSFFMCDEWWKREKEITLIEMETDSDIDSYVMEEEILTDWLDEEKQRLIFVFDYPGDRGLFIELSEIVPGKNLSKATCTKKQGEAPLQFIKEDDVEAIQPVVIIPAKVAPLIDDEDDEEDEDEESFYGEDDFNPDELDAEGFEGLDETDTEKDIQEDIELI